MESIKKFLEKERKEFELLKEIDKHQKKLNLVECRYITKSFADRNATYQIIGETKNNYILQWILGEDPYPKWGEKVKVSKEKILKILKQRDNSSLNIPSRKF